MLKHYFILAIRNLLRNKMQSLLSILGLAVAFFCFGAFAYIMHALATPDEWAANHERIVRLTTDDYARTALSLTDEEIERIESLPEVGSICKLIDNYFYGQIIINDEHVDLHSKCIDADTSFHHMFAPKLIAGAWNDALLSPNSLAICETWAIRFFGSAEAAIGKEILEYPTTYVVRAVVDDLPPNNSMAFLNNILGWRFNNTKDEGYLWFMYYIMAADGYSTQQLKSAINQLDIQLTELKGESVRAATPAPIPITCEEAAGSKTALWFGYSLLALLITLPGWLILFSALSNFFHLLLSNIMMRRREYVLRRAHGAHTWNLWLMVSTQVVVTMILVGFASLLIIEIAAPLLQFNLGSTSIIFQSELMLKQDIKHIAILLLIGLVVAWIAVARIRKDSLQEAMKSSTGTRPGRHILRNILLCWQLTVGCLFIALLAAVYMQLDQNQKSILPQFSATDKENILVASIWPGENREYNIEDKLKAMPDVESYALGNGSPINGGWKEYMIDHRGDTIMVSNKRLNLPQMEFLHIPLLSGEWAKQENEVVADPDFLDRYELELGSQIVVTNRFIDYEEERRVERYVDKTYTITGVVDCRMSDFNSNMTHGLKPDPGFFSIYKYGSTYWIKCRPGTTDKVKNAICGILADQGLFIEADKSFHTLKQLIDKQFDGLRQFIPIFWLFGFIAVAIALLGIYSAITVDTTYRRKEMAIRKINGAKTRHIALLFARLYIILLGIASLIAFPVAHILIDGIVSNSFTVTFYHGIFFYIALFLLIACFVALTIGAQIWKIARINPAIIVKSE